MISWKCFSPAVAALALAACSSTTVVLPVGPGGEGGAGGSPVIQWTTSSATSTASSSTSSSTGTGTPLPPPLCSDTDSETLSPGVLDSSASYHTISGPYDQSFVVLALDADSNIILAGGTVGVTDFSAGPTDPVGTGLDQTDLFFAKYDPTGTLLWVHRFAAAQNLISTGIAVDSQGNIAVTGSYNRGSIDFGSTVLAEPPNIDIDLFIAEVGPDGAFRWARTIGTQGIEKPGKVAIVPGDDVVVVSTTTMAQIAIDRFSPDGQVVFQSASGSLHGKTSLEAPIDVLRADSHGDLFMTGTGGGVFDDGAPMLKGGIYLAKYSGNTGKFAWARRFRGIGFDEGDKQQTMVVVDDDVVIAGLPGQDFDAGNGTFSGACAGDTGMYLARLSGKDGDVVWSRGIRSQGALAPDLFLDSQGHLVLTAILGGPADPGGGTFEDHFAAYAVTYDAATGTYEKARELLEVSGLYMSSFFYSAHALDATDHLVTAAAFFDTTEYGLGTATSTGWGDVMIVRSPL